MAFETFVRPVVFPNIRPIPTQAFQSGDDPTQGLAIIRGASPKTLTLNYSKHFTTSKSQAGEQSRRVDTMRVFQKNDDQTVNRDNYVDLDVPTRISMREGQDDKRYDYARMETSDNVELKKRDKFIRNPKA